MAKFPDDVDPRQLTVVARRVLLDGVDALRDHLPALTVVGAQAVHLRSPDAAISNAPFTSDGDLSIDPMLLGDQPHLDASLRAAGFDLKYAHQPGLWERPEYIGDTVVPVELDLLVPRRQRDSKSCTRSSAPPAPPASTWLSVP